MPPGGRSEAQRFYTGVMGLREIPTPSSLDPGRIIWFAVGDDGDEIHLFAEVSAHTGMSGQHLCLVVDDLEEMRQKLEADGVQIGQEPEITNRPRFSFRDPFGNKIEITEIHGSYLDAEV